MVGRHLLGLGDGLHQEHLRNKKGGDVKSRVHSTAVSNKLQAEFGTDSATEVGKIQHSYYF
jgi:hypothetical protein